MNLFRFFYLIQTILRKQEAPFLYTYIIGIYYSPLFGFLQMAITSNIPDILLYINKFLSFFLEKNKYMFLFTIYS